MEIRAYSCTVFWTYTVHLNALAAIYNRILKECHVLKENLKLFFQLHVCDIYILVNCLLMRTVR